MQQRSGPQDVYESVLARMPESVAIYELDGTIVYLNPTTERLFGRVLAEIRGRRLWDIFAQAINNPFYTTFHEVAEAGGERTLLHYYPPFDRWYDNRFQRVGDHIHVIAVDVTEDLGRRRRLEALHRISAVVTAEERKPTASLQAIADALAEELDATCWLALLGPGEASLEIAALAAKDPEVLQAGRRIKHLPADVGPPAQALGARATILALRPDLAAQQAVEEEASAFAYQFPASSVVVAPLFVGDTAIGVLVASRHGEARPLTEHDRLLVQEMAPSVGLYLGHARRVAEAATLRDRLAAVADSNPALVSFIDRDERYLYVNASYERWFGAPRESFLGRKMQDVIGPTGYAAIAPAVREALGGRPVRFRANIPYRSGERVVDSLYHPIFDADGGVEGMAVTALDVTAEKRLADQERALHESDRRATRRLKSLLAVTTKLAEADGPGAIAQTVIEEGLVAVGARMGALWLVDASGTELILQAQQGFAAEHVGTLSRVPTRAQTPLCDCLNAEQSLWIESEAHFNARYPVVDGQFGSISFFAPPFALLPVVLEGGAVGCIHFALSSEHSWDSDDRTYMEVLASHAGQALRRAKLYSELRDVSETRQAMIQASPAGTMLLDANGIVHSWNAAAERIFGWAAQEVIGLPLPGLPDDLRDEVHQNLARVLEGQVLEAVRTRRKTKSDTWLDVEFYASPVRFSDGRVFCKALVFDVSDRVRMERGRQLVSEASAILSRSLDWEQSLEEVLGLPVLASFSTACQIEITTAPGEPIVLRAGAWTPAGSEARMLTMPLLAGHRSLGSIVWQHSGRDFDAVDGRTLTDLCERIAAAVDNGLLYEEARAARQQAEAASRAKDEFLAMLGHELRNPLAPITTALQLMRLGPEKSERARAVIERQVKHLTHLVDDLLDVSRITGGKVELRRENLPLAAVVAKAIETVSPLYDQRKHALDVDVPVDIAVHADPTRLAQIVANLLSNAAKYTPPEGRISVRVRREGQEVVLNVTDNGIGIDETMLPQVFDLFVQAPQQSARPEGGLGLGLAIVRSLVSLHGGQVDVSSPGLGKGSSFTVRLPASPPDEPHRATPTVAAAALGPRRKILVVDDNQDAALLMADALEGLGHDVRTAFDGLAAVETAEAFAPDVVVLDIGLPIMDGYEVAQRLRSDPRHANVRLLALTGYGQETDRARTKAAGFFAHLAKPVTVEAIADLVRASDANRTAVP